jgi:hypothetical protein
MEVSKRSIKEIFSADQHSALALNRDVQKYPTWTEDQIRERGSWMADVAARVWPVPQMDSAAS